MHLKCETHGRRVVVTDTKVVVHRNTGKVTERCESAVLLIGGLRVGGRATLARQIANRRNRRGLRNA